MRSWTCYLQVRARRILRHQAALHYRRQDMSRGTHDSAVGQRAPSFTLPLADGGSVSLEQFAGTPVLVSFLSHAA